MSCASALLYATSCYFHSYKFATVGDLVPYPRGRRQGAEPLQLLSLETGCSHTASNCYPKQQMRFGQEPLSSNAHIGNVDHPQMDICYIIYIYIEEQGRY